MIVQYPSDKTFELRVKDTGALDEFSVFVNGTLRSQISDGEVHRYKIDHSPAGMAIAVHFLGTDGGKSAIVDVTDASNPSVVESRTGLLHSYLLKG